MGSDARRSSQIKPLCCLYPAINGGRLSSNKEPTPANSSVARARFGPNPEFFTSDLLRLLATNFMNNPALTFHFELRLAGHRSQLVDRSNLQLTDSLTRKAQLIGQRLQRYLLRRLKESKTAPDDRLFP